MDKGIAAVVGGEGEERRSENEEKGKKCIFPNLPKMALLGD